MSQPLVTIGELHPARRSTISLTVRVVVTALTAGTIAFLVTWLVLAWPTVVANVSWQLRQANHSTSAPPAPAVTPFVTADHLLIPSINVDAPVFYDTEITDSVGKLPDGVVHVRGTAAPGQIGTVFILGHSSGYWWQSGAYTQVFALLDKLTAGDEIYLNHAGVTYRYRVTSSETVRPDAADQLTQPTDRRSLNLMTCTPVGTTLNRLIVHAELIN